MGLRWLIFLDNSNEDSMIGDIPIYNKLIEYHSRNIYFLYANYIGGISSH